VAHPSSARAAQRIAPASTLALRRCKTASRSLVRRPWIPRKRAGGGCYFLHWFETCMLDALRAVIVPRSRKGSRMARYREKLPFAPRIPMLARPLPECDNRPMYNGKNGHRHRRVIPPETSRQPGKEVAHSILGYSTVWFTRHALTRMKQRGVTQAEVFQVLKSPNRKGLRTQPGRERWRKTRSAKYAVDVVFERWPEQLCVVTVILIQPD